MTADRPGLHGVSGGWLTLPPVELVVSVDLAPTPDIPLASLRDVLVPRLDAEGNLVDWVLSTADVEHRSTASEYWAWRQSWRRSWRLGPVTNVITLDRHLGELDHDMVSVARGIVRRTLDGHDQGIVVTQPEAIDLADELELVRLALSVDERTGTGIVDDMADPDHPAGLARTWMRPDRKLVLAATPATAVLLRHDDGLVVLHGTGGQHEPAMTDATDPGIAEVIADIVAADLRHDPVVLTVRGGTQRRLAAAEARPLAWLVPHSLLWHLHDIPIAAVWAEWFAGWAAAIEVASERGTDLRVTSQHVLV